ncbi:MAG: MTH895/ArsE family thioredoxin-like protein [Thermodesulfobacteriota bacterium]
MSAKVRQTRVKGNKVGIMGLEEALQEVSQNHAHSSEQEIKEALLSKLEKDNYIPPPAREDYAQAFYQEYCKYLGLEVKEEDSSSPSIKVLGPGCSRCDNMHQEIVDILAKLGLALEVEHITDPKEIASFGVMGTPALVINNQVKCVGRVPRRQELKNWLQEIQNSS